MSFKIDRRKFIILIIFILWKSKFNCKPIVWNARSTLYVIRKIYIAGVNDSRVLLNVSSIMR